MILPDEVWCVHILAHMPLNDLYNFYRTSHKSAELVEKAVNWRQRYNLEFPGHYPDLDCSHFLNYYTRASADLCCWGPRPVHRVFDKSLSIKNMASAFQGSTLTVLDTNGTVHGVDIPPSTPLSEIWGLTFYIYGIPIGDACQINAWTSKTGPSLGILLDEPIVKVSSVGYLCGVLTASRDIYWWKYPHRDHGKSLESKPLDVPCGIRDMVATRYGFKVIGDDGNLYSIRVLDRYLKEQPIETRILKGSFNRIDQTADKYVVYGEQCFIGDGDELKLVQVPGVQSIQMVDEVTFMLTEDWDLYSVGSSEKIETFGVQKQDFLTNGGQVLEGRYLAVDPIKIPGKYACIVGIEGELCTLRMV